MPINRDGVHHQAAPAAEEISQPGHQRDNRKRDQTDEDVKAMKSGKSEKRGCEEVAIDADVVGVKSHVFGQLAGQEDGTQHNTEDPPQKEAAAIVFCQATLGQKDRAAAGKEEQAEKQRARDVQIVWARAGG